MLTYEFPIESNILNIPKRINLVTLVLGFLKSNFKGLLLLKKATNFEIKLAK